MPSISIIIPVYNVEKYLTKCLDSILVDNAFTGQVMCVNDGSTDGSAAILDEYAAKYPNIEIITQTNAGLSAARNAGFDRAMGNYVFFVDSDDWVIPGAIEKILKKLEGEDVLYFNTKTYQEGEEWLSGDIDLMEMRHVRGRYYLEAVYDKPRSMPYVCVWGGVYKRSFLKEHHLYNEPGIYHEDNYFTPQVLLAAQDVTCLNEYVYVRRRRSGSITASVTKKHIVDLLYVARNLYRIYARQSDVPLAFYQDLCGNYVNIIYWSYNNAIPLNRFWKLSDSSRMLRCAHDSRAIKIAKLTFIHPYVAYNYMQDRLPQIMRRFVNRFL